MTAYNLVVETPGTSIAVVYEEGVFKPQEPVPASVKPHHVYRLPVPENGSENEDREIQENWKAIQEVIGIIDDEAGPTDVAENHDRYLYGDLRPR